MSDYNREEAIALLSYNGCWLEKWLANAIADDMRKLLAVYEAAKWVIRDGTQGTDDSALVRYEPLEALDEAVSSVQLNERNEWKRRHDKLSAEIGQWQAMRQIIEQHCDDLCRCADVLNKTPEMGRTFASTRAELLQAARELREALPTKSIERLSAENRIMREALEGRQWGKLNEACDALRAQTKRGSVPEGPDTDE